MKKTKKGYSIVCIILFRFMFGKVLRIETIPNKGGGQLWHIMDM